MVNTHQEEDKQIKSNIYTLAVIHGMYYIVTGLWPIIHMDSFTFITGPKMDLWLVETVGMLAAAIGIGLTAGGWRKKITFPLSLIAVTAATGFILIDVIYVWGGIISPIYLFDAVLEFILLCFWVVFIIQNRIFEFKHRPKPK